MQPTSSSSPRRRPFESLRNRKQFDGVFAHGKRVRCGPFSLVVRPVEGCFRIGFKIGRKVGKAVIRNRLRRRFRGVFDLLEPHGLGGAEVVVLASPAALDLRFDKLRERITKALKSFGFRPRGLALG